MFNIKITQRCGDQISDIEYSGMHSIKIKQSANKQSVKVYGADLKIKEDVGDELLSETLDSESLEILENFVNETPAIPTLYILSKLPLLDELLIISSDQTAVDIQKEYFEYIISGCWVGNVYSNMVAALTEILKDKFIDGHFHTSLANITNLIENLKSEVTSEIIE